MGDGHFRPPWSSEYFKNQMPFLVHQSTKDNTGSVKEPNKFHNYETEKITRETSDAAEYIE